MHDAEEPNLAAFARLLVNESRGIGRQYLMKSSGACIRCIKD